MRIARFEVRFALEDEPEAQRGGIPQPRISQMSFTSRADALAPWFGKSLNGTTVVSQG